MKGYCYSCGKDCVGVKKPFNIFFLVLGGFVFYGAYRLLLVRRNKCPVCGLGLGKK